MQQVDMQCVETDCYSEIDSSWLAETHQQHEGIASSPWMSFLVHMWQETKLATT